MLTDREEIERLRAELASTRGLIVTAREVVSAGDTRKAAVCLSLTLFHIDRALALGEPATVVPILSHRVLRTTRP